ncbi:MAG: tRNA lysidine(34) synthetase TilS [Syntrophaceae bacterium]
MKNYNLLIAEVRKTIKKHNMLKKGERIVVAVSGGPDSVALLKVLEVLSHEYGLTLIAAHLNHGLREEADREEKFVRKRCNEMEITCESKKVNINELRKNSGKCIEDISRDIRYEFLDEVAKRQNAQKIALAHHLNDQIETIFMNFIRGSGPDGLKGMVPVRDSMYIRPLLGVNRKKILSFLEARKIPFMTDTSNMENIYLRNRIRHLLIPQIKAQYNPHLDINLANMAEIMRLENDYLEKDTDAALSKLVLGSAEDEIKINIPEIMRYHEAIQWRIVKEILQKLSPDQKGIEYDHIKAVVELAYSNRPSGHLNLPFRIVARREYDSLIVTQERKSLKQTVCEQYDYLHYIVTIPGIVNIAELGRTMKFDFVDSLVWSDTNMPNIAYMDYDTIIGPLIIRSIKPGDRIKPLGMKGTKKIKTYFIDEKIPMIKRKMIPLLLDQDSVLWIAGLRMSERVKITKKTIKILRVEIV